jgi:hypothetical protein
LLLFLSIESDEEQTFSLEQVPDSFKVKSFSVKFTDHDSIVIDGNANFSSQASIEGWSGDGSPGDPYNISYLSISGNINIATLILIFQ